MLAIKRRNKALKTCAIVTAANSKYFIALQYLIISIRKWHGKNQCIICINLGLKEPELSWLKTNNIIVKNEPKPTLLSIWYKGENKWETWNKPQYLNTVKKRYKKLIWIDADCILLDRIDFIDKQVSSTGFVIFSDNTNCNKEWIRKVIKNENSLDILYDRELPNAGVFGINLDKNVKLFNRWIKIVKQAAKDKEFRSSIKCWDQGALQLAIEELNLSDHVIKDNRYNYCFARNIVNEDQKNYINKFIFFEYLTALKNEGIKIVHIFNKAVYTKIGFEDDIINSLKRRFYNPENPEEILTQTIRKFPLGMS